MTRTILNGMIRFTHRVSLVRFLMGSLLISEEEALSMTTDRKKMMDYSSPADQKLCEYCLKRANRMVAYHLITSPFMSVLLVPLFAMVLGRMGLRIANKFVLWQTPRFEALDNVFYLNGQTI